MGVYDPNTDGRVQARLTWHRRPCTRCVLMEGGECCLQKNPVSGGVLMGVAASRMKIVASFACFFLQREIYADVCSLVVGRCTSLEGFWLRERGKKESFMVLFYLEG